MQLIFKGFTLKKELNKEYEDKVKLEEHKQKK